MKNSFSLISLKKRMFIGDSFCSLQNCNKIELRINSRRGAKIKQNDNFFMREKNSLSKLKKGKKKYSIHSTVRLGNKISNLNWIHDINDVTYEINKLRKQDTFLKNKPSK